MGGLFGSAEGRIPEECNRPPLTLPPPPPLIPALYSCCSHEIGTVLNMLIIRYYNPMSGAVDDSSPPESNTATSTATCTCANGLCMDSAICPCLARASTCAAECKCMDCENPLNVLRVVHQVPLERVLADICLLQNLVANVSNMEQGNKPECFVNYSKQ